MDILNTYTPQPALQKPSVVEGAKREEIRAAAEDFEAVFITEMMRPIFDGIETDGFFGGGSAEKTYQSMLVDEYGKKVSQAGGIGLADAVEKELLTLQEFKQSK